MIERIEKLIVHSGRFHADDAMCAAIARYINPNVIIERARNASENPEGGVIVADIGNGRYDHHLPDSRRREDSGELYAACGLLLEDCWPLIFKREEDYLQFDKTYIRPIELADNGVRQNPLTAAINSFVPAWDSDETMDEGFEKAVEMLYGVIDRFVRRAESEIRAEDIVKSDFAKSDGRVVALSQPLPWMSVLADSTAEFVVFKDMRGGYDLQVVPVAAGSKTAKKDLPGQWLKEKPEGCTFVHSQLFLAAFDTKEHAMNAAESIA